MNSVSVIIPLYKGAKYVASLTEMIYENVSIAASDGLINYAELIFINDYPLEKIAIECSYTDLLSIKLINNQVNSGIHQSRINGIVNSCGNYILFLDQDDKIKNCFLSSQICLADNNKADLVIANGIIEYPNSEKTIYDNHIMHSLTKHIMAYAYLDNRIISPGQCLIRRSAIPALWLTKALSRNGADDLFLWLLMLSSSGKKRIALNPDKLYRHVNTDQNISLDLPAMYGSVYEMLGYLYDSGAVKVSILNVIAYRTAFLSGNAYCGHISSFTRILISVLYSLKSLIRRIRIMQNLK